MNPAVLISEPSGAGGRDQAVAGDRRPGPVYTFLPARGESKVGVVQSCLGRTWTEDLELAVLLANFTSREVSVWQPQTPPDIQRLDERSWGALVRSEDGVDVLEAGQIDPAATTSLLEYARRRYGVVSVDLTGAREIHSAAVLRASSAIFFVTDSDRRSLNAVADRIAWLRSMHLESRCGILLRRVDTGLRPDLAEELTGVPVCSLVESRTQLHHLAHWLGSKSAMRLAGVI